MVATAAELFGRAEMIIKVKEPQPDERSLLRRGQIVFTYFHLAADRQLTEDLLHSGAIAVAYETLRDDHGRLPLLTPMSEVAGRMSVQEGAKYLETAADGPRYPAGRSPRRRARPRGHPWAAASSARMPLRSRPDSAPISGCWTSTWTGSATWTTSCRPM